MSNRRSGLAAVAFLASLAPALAFEISSQSLSDGKWASKYIGDEIVGCSGGNVSPAITWKDPPTGTKSFGLTLFDPDAPTGRGFWHWLVWNIPATATGVSEGKVPSGAIQGRTDAGRAGYITE